MRNKIVRFFLVVCAPVVFFSCGGEVLPKPKGMLRLSYPESKYREVLLPCSYSFEKNDLSELYPARRNQQCWYNLEYKKMRATMYISYYQVNNNLDSLLRDAQNLTQEHVVKADGIIQTPFENKKNNVYGVFYEVSGNAASPSQFYVTDSINHFIVGSMYFKVKPNYDSILPAANYLRNDMMHLMETINWR
ncbi:gliding motility lipoprotein GldD [Aquimarina sp. I32.4]|uniref:gliding motility lipoprotein GldD n=1 Tax=Aquimarina sp. I32.4 TaxID=2053903 RepID=UPI000CDF1073|nr:gliding motility lipoprotein GldD [Aquimarina sp. I32.4]